MREEKLTLLKTQLNEIIEEIMLQEEKGNLLNGVGVCLMVLVYRAEQTLGLLKVDF